MKNLPKEKRDHIILVALACAILIGAAWFFLISPQREKLAKSAQTTESIKGKVEKARNLVNKREVFENDLLDQEKKLKLIEDTMASGDLSSWGDKTISNFASEYPVEIVQISPPSLRDVQMFPNFPYRAVLFKIQGKAYYHDFGSFLADFENRFPYIRAQKIELRPATSVLPEEGEKLDFTMEIVSLVKP